MAKAGTLGRLAAAVYNRTARSAPRARVVHTYHGHVLEGYFSPARPGVHRASNACCARVSDAHRRDLAGHSRASCSRPIASAAPTSTAWCRSASISTPFAAIDDAGARRGPRERWTSPAGAPVVTTVGRLTAIKQHELFLDIVRRSWRRPSRRSSP